MTGRQGKADQLALEWNPMPGCPRTLLQTFAHGAPCARDPTRQPNRREAHRKSEWASRQVCSFQKLRPTRHLEPLKSGFPWSGGSSPKTLQEASKQL